MTADQLKAVGDAWAAASAGDVEIVIARINDRCEARRLKEAEFEAVAFTARPESRHASVLGLLGDASVRQRLVAAGIVT